MRLHSNAIKSIKPSDKKKLLGDAQNFIVKGVSKV